MGNRSWTLGFIALIAPAVLGAPAIAGDAKPLNVVIILADDLGYGDVACYNRERGKIPTPSIDSLATQGMRFTDAHMSSSLCTPSRYALLTGRYDWRTRLQSGVANTWERPLIAPDRLTIAGFARAHGYDTACCGKWHLGWDWPISAGQMPLFTKYGAEATPEQVAAWKEIFSKPIAGGPTTRGFDHYFGPDVPNWPPFCFIADDRTVGIPSTLLPASDVGGNLASKQGPAVPDWKLDQVLPTVVDHACEEIRRHAGSARPLLLYLPLTAPHTPIAVAAEWRAKSELNAYADFVMETDAMVGRVLETLKTSGLDGNTLVVFTSDNGCSPHVGQAELLAKGHYPSGPLRGYKFDAWEGGHRLPFIVRWPGAVTAGSTCRQTICATDLIATVADILGDHLPPDAGEDSVSILPLLRGADQPLHEVVVHHAGSGVFAIRSGRWKAIFGPGSGAPDPKAKPLLYDLDADLGEEHDLAAEHPDEVERLAKLLLSYVDAGRTTPGPKRKNDGPVRNLPKPE
jgi:arylsulfatase A-like enzyme